MRSSRRLRGSLPIRGPFKVAPLELATGLAWGHGGAGLRPQGRETARAALEAVVLNALRRPPCIVTFSGGRDSSAVLAVATDVARREGLELPVPVSLRFPAEPRSEESPWQRAVVEHLRLPEWHRVVLHDELDWVGPYAQRGLSRHGLLWPQNAHFMMPAYDAAAGGSVLTGQGGDQVLSPVRLARLDRVIHGVDKPEPRDVASFALAFSPRSLRGAVRQRRGPFIIPWLTAEGQRDLDRARRRAFADEPLTWRRRLLDDWACDRSRLLARHSLALLASDADVVVEHPLDSERFLRALAAEPLLPQYRSRTQVMLALFGDLLPEQVVRRRDKASFNDAFWSTDSRALSAAVTDDDLRQFPLVDGPALRGAWQAQRVDGRSGWLLQATWLTRHDSARLPDRRRERDEGVTA